MPCAQVHCLIEHCLLRNMDALQTEAALEALGIASCFTRIGARHLISAAARFPQAAGGTH